MRYVFCLSFMMVLGSSVLATDFPTPFNTEEDRDRVPSSPQAAADAIKLPQGFAVSVFAAEPDVQNPIAMAWDARGRLWIAENYTYADGKTHFDLGLRDRVLIFDDTDGDGRFDSRKVFTDEAQMLTSIEVGHGGVWLMCPPRLLFIPDANRDDIPDAPAQVVLDGFTVQNQSYHNFANGLRWGPDGWLYGRCGGSCPGEIGAPGTPDNQRVPLRGGIWRYHPLRKQFETLMTGTTNPWGHDWDALGECFFVNTVNGHFWHLIPGGHCSRNATLDPNPRTYQLMEQHADHWHFDTGKSWADSRDGAANNLGGGHAHSGATIYLGNNWPQALHGHLFTVNLHGRRLNNEIIERSGSGFTAHHGQDFLISDDPWFRAIDLSYGPDGGVFIIDWSDVGECHERDGVHRTSGRIFKVTYGKPRVPAPFDLHQQTDQELVALHRSTNEWDVRQARLVLSERRAAGKRLDQARTELLNLLKPEQDRQVRARALLTLFAIEGLDQDFALSQLRHPDEAVRTWAVRMLTDRWPLDGPLGPVPYDPQRTQTVAREAQALCPTLIALARSDESGLVRLALASTLQRLPVSQRAPLAAALVSRPEDQEDQNLPLLVWYGLIPAADADLQSLVPVAQACRWPLTRKLIARRLAEEIERQPVPLGSLLTHAAGQPDEYRRDIIAGVSEALRGWRKATPPSNWKTVQSQLEATKDPELRERVRELSVVFGDGRALDEVKKIVFEKTAAVSARRSALETLIEARPDDLRQICEKLINENYLNVIAAQGLALFDDPEIGAQLVKAYRKFRAVERPQILSILVSRRAFARALLQGVANGQVPREEVSAYHIRQIHSLGDPALVDLANEAWGQLRDSPDEKRVLMAELKSRLGDDVLSQADLSQGRLVFSTICAKCHRLYGEGGTIGPDLTGSNRNNLDYLVENIVDPSAVVNKDYRMTVLVLADGRVLNGLITEQTERTVTVQSPTEKTTVEKSEIEETHLTSLSPMPEGMLAPLSPEQVRDLIAYLRHPSQVALPPGAALKTSATNP